MKNIIQPGDQIPPGIGGKASNLLLLASLGVNVPPFVVIPDTWFESFCQPADLDDRGIPRFDRIRLPEALMLDIKACFSDKVKYFAVRSSYRDEDSDQFSFAGQFKSRLFVPFEDLEQSILDVWSSCIRGNVTTYQQEHQLESTYYLSIIIQEMLAPDISGVAFSMNPLTGHRKQKVINTVYGVGEGLVSGDLNADQFLIFNDQVESTIAEKTHYYALDTATGRGVIKTPTPADKISHPSLAREEIEEITRAVDLVKNHYGKHQDIEFAFCGPTLYLLQSRPVTSLSRLPDRHGQYIIWDNSNIIESYPDLTLPLTFSYIISLYERAYRQFVELMGVSKKEIEEHAEYFANMLGLLNGRIYYNLRSWYVMISMLPGYAFNARAMEQMMGVKERFDLAETAHRSKFRDLFRIGNMLLSIIYNLITLESQKRNFVRLFETMQAETRAIDPDSVSPDQIMKLYKKQESLMLRIWKAPLVNDFFAMIYFGILKKSMTGLFGKDTNVHNDLLIGDNTIITTRPAKLIVAMVNKIYESPALYDLFKRENSEAILRQLENNQKHIGLYELFNEYIEQFGDRLVGELKLETKTYKQYPTLFIAVLQSYIHHDRKPETFDSRSGPEARMDAEKRVRQKLRGKPLKRWMIGHVIKKTRKLVSGRENLRLYRTRAFGGARTAFSKIGEIFFSEGLLLHPDDIFMLTKEEIFDFIKGTSVNSNLKSLVALRQAQYEQFRKEDVQSERIKTHGIVYQGNSFFQEGSIEEQTDGLRGIGCCRGVVSGKVKIINNPEDAFDMEGDILVTTTTDPGWVTIFPSVKGILVERGSLLSHAAIVSREMGIPCIVGINGLTAKLKSGDHVEMDGEKGIINIF